MRYICMLFVIIMALSACSVQKTMFSINNEDDRAFIRTVWAEPNPAVFTTAAEADLAWERARYFVSRFGAPLRKSYGFYLDTLPPVQQFNDGVVSLGFTLSRLDEGDKTEIYVKCYADCDTYADRFAAKALLYYMRTGILKPNLLCKDYDFKSVIRESQQ